MNDLLSGESLPRLILIGDGFTDRKRWDQILSACEYVPWVHLRDHEADAGTFRENAEELAEHIWSISPATMISVNARLDVAEELEAGFHAGSKGDDVSTARNRLGPEAVIGFSAHYLTEAQAAVQDGADYLFFSPIFASPSKPGHMGVGLDELRTFCEGIGDDAVVYAVGGVTPERVESCLTAGAHGVGVLSGILHEEDVQAAAEAYLDVL